MEKLFMADLLQNELHEKVIGNGIWSTDERRGV